MKLLTKDGIHYCPHCGANIESLIAISEVSQLMDIDTEERGEIEEFGDTIKTLCPKCCEELEVE